MTKRLLPIAEAMESLGGVSRTTVYKLAGDGLIERVNIGRRGFITADSIDRYIDGLVGRPA